jgi:multidrug efflux pump subunit AcrA (membrane-fusion protein)
MPATIDVVGTVEPLTRSVLGTEVPGLVVEMPVRQGDAVERGQLICKLNDDVLRLQVDQEDARLSMLQARLDQLINGTRAEELAWLKADFDAAQATSDRWSFELERIKRLLGAEHANQREYQDALAEQRSALERLNAVKAKYDEGVAGPRKEMVEAARYEVAEQRAVVARLKSDLGKTEIRAPFGGHVVRRFAEVGNWLAVGANVVEVVDLSEALVRVNAPESAFPYAVQGAAASVRIDALGVRLQGTIRHVIPQADLAARTFPVEIALPNADGVLKAGMFARATVPAGSSLETVAVPKDAVIDSHGSMQVALVVPGEKGPMAVPTSVTLGGDDGAWVAVTSGNIPADAEVVTHGNERIFFPQPVVVVASPAEVNANPPEKAPADGGAAGPAQGAQS